MGPVAPVNAVHRHPLRRQWTDPSAESPDDIRNTQYQLDAGPWLIPGRPTA
jgi:hypothetical protein